MLRIKIRWFLGILQYTFRDLRTHKFLRDFNDTKMHCWHASLSPVGSKYDKHRSELQETAALTTGKKRTSAFGQAHQIHNDLDPVRR